MFQNYWKPMLIMIGVIVVASVSARLLSGQETLAEYASKNPDIAYGDSTSAISSEADSSLFDSAVDSSTAYSSIYDYSDSASSIGSSSMSSEDKSDADSSSSNDSSSLEVEGSNIDRIYYTDNFYHEAISDAVKERIWNISYPEDCPVELSSLRYCSLKYIDFDGNEQTGELICNKTIADDILEIFYVLYINEYRIESIKLIDEYDGDDTASMEANNTSCFNYRVVEGTTTLSKHALGMAIDLNPFYNPYITYNSDGTTNCSPADARQYEDRSLSFAYKIDENDLAYKLFTEHGFTWGGNWNSCKDYQHFQK